MLTAVGILAISYNYPWQNPDLSQSERVENLISLLTVEEKASLLSASSAAVPRIELPQYRWGRECERGDVSGPTGTAYPCGMALAASFDPDLVYEVAAQTALEVRGNVNSRLGYIG
jgi:beta-glucosidase